MKRTNQGYWGGITGVGEGGSTALSRAEGCEEEISGCEIGFPRKYQISKPVLAEASCPDFCTSDIMRHQLTSTGLPYSEALSMLRVHTLMIKCTRLYEVNGLEAYALARFREELCRIPLDVFVDFVSGRDETTRIMHRIVRSYITVTMMQGYECPMMNKRIAMVAPAKVFCFLRSS